MTSYWNVLKDVLINFFIKRYKQVLHFDQPSSIDEAEWLQIAISFRVVEIESVTSNQQNWHQYTTAQMI